MPLAFWFCETCKLSTNKRLFIGTQIRDALSVGLTLLRYLYVKLTSPHKIVEWFQLFQEVISLRLINSSLLRKIFSIFFLNRIHVREGRLTDITTIMAWYSIITKVSTDHLDNEIKSTNNSSVWKYVKATLQLFNCFNLAALTSPSDLPSQTKFN